jgi:enoyl-CoA hydratase
MTTNSLSTYQLTDGVAVITMDDGKVNAMSSALQQSIHASLDQAEADKAVVVLAGRQEIFSAGFDLKTIAAGGDAAVEMLRGGFQLAERLLSFPLPTIAACPGHAIAMGVFILQSVDFRIAVDGNYRLTANEVAIGMTVPYSALEILRLRLTPSAVHRAATLAEAFSPQEGLACGLVDRVVERDALMATAMEVANRFKTLNFGAHAATKRRLRENSLVAFRAGVEREFAR